MQKIVFALSLLLSLDSLALQASSPLRNGRSGLFVQTMGATCFTLDIGADTLPCNPAYMAKERERSFKANIFVGNNVSYLREASDVVNGKANQQTIEKLFSDQKSSEFEISLDAAYLSETFGLAAEPYRLSYYSLFQNPALPEITLFASLESSVRAQLTSYTQEDVYLGIQLRYLQRKMISSRFFLTDVLSEDRNQYLDPKNQNFIFLEPGFLYSQEDNEWKPEVSLTILNLGFQNGDRTEADPIPEYNLGGGFSHEIGYGRWGWVLNAGWNKEAETFKEVLTLGSYFEMGILQIFGSLAEKSNGAGFAVHFDSFNLGLSYSAKAEKFGYEKDVYSRRLYFLIGAEI